MRRAARLLGLQHWRLLIIGAGIIVLVLLVAQPTGDGLVVHLGR